MDYLYFFGAFDARNELKNLSQSDITQSMTAYFVVFCMYYVLYQIT